MGQENIIMSKSYEFSLKIIKLYKYLTKEEKEYTLSKQLLRSCTSIGANIKESKYAQSSKDFLSKLHIALKEAGETEYWLNLLKDSDYIQEQKFIECNDELKEIIKLLTSITKRIKENIN